MRFLPSLRLLYAEKLHFRISTPLAHGMLCFEGPGTQVGATWAEKSSPPGPACARSGKSEGSGQSSFAGRCGLAVKVMETAGNQAGFASSRRAKSFKATRHMIRSSIYMYIYIYIYTQVNPLPGVETSASGSPGETVFLSIAEAIRMGLLTDEICCAVLCCVVLCGAENLQAC